MKNVTITLDEKVARWARVWAARHDVSMSRVVGDMLRERMEQDSAYAKAMRSFLGRRSRALKTAGGYPSRDEVHGR
jgi:plasmid stability protein